MKIKTKDRDDDARYSIKIYEFGRIQWKEKGNREKIKKSFSLFEKFK